MHTVKLEKPSQKPHKSIASRRLPALTTHGSSGLFDSEMWLVIDRKESKDKINVWNIIHIANTVIMPPSEMIQLNQVKITTKV